MTRLVIAGGGTGGHLFPGVAIAEELLAREPTAEVLFVGTARGIEARVVPKLGMKLALIEASGLKTVGALGALRGLLKVPRALWQSRKIWRDFKPDAVIGVGGYASGPVVLAAWLRRVPTAILEQNSIPGLANKLLGRIVRRVFLAFEETKRFFKAKRIVMSGNPIRKAMRERLVARTAGNSGSGHSPAAVGVGGPIPYSANSEPPVKSAAPASATSTPFPLLCFGGSLGARAVNTVMVDAAIDLANSEHPVHLALVHQTGPDDKDAVSAGYREAQLPAPTSVDVRDFIDDMAAEYFRARLVVARAGATTIAELGVVGRAAILVPYPFAADDHQHKNAQALDEAEAALVFRQADLDGKKLATAIRSLVEDPDRLERMQSAMRSLGRPQAAATIVDWLTQR